MPSLILDGECLSVNLESERLRIVRSEIDEKGARRQTRTQVPLRDLDRVVVMGRPSITTPVLQKLMFEGIPCYFATARNRWIGSLLPDGNRDAARRLRQYETARDNALRLRLARMIVAVKIRNSRREPPPAKFSTASPTAPAAATTSTNCAAWKDSPPRATSDVSALSSRPPYRSRAVPAVRPKAPPTLCFPGPTPSPSAKSNAKSGSAASIPASGSSMKCRTAPPVSPWT